MRIDQVLVDVDHIGKPDGVGEPGHLGDAAAHGDVGPAPRGQSTRGVKCDGCEEGAGHRPGHVAASHQARDQGPRRRHRGDRGGVEHGGRLLRRSRLRQRQGLRRHTWKMGQPSPFPLSGVVPGFAQGIEGMKVGGRREIVIPSALGYGPSGDPPAVAPNETLVFVVDLVAVH